MGKVLEHNRVTPAPLLPDACTAGMRLCSLESEFEGDTMVGEPIYPGSWVEVRGQAHQFSPKWKQFYTCKTKQKKSARTYRRENSDISRNISRNISPFPNVAFTSPVFGQFLLG